MTSSSFCSTLLPKTTTTTKTLLLAAAAAASSSPRLWRLRRWPRPNGGSTARSRRSGGKRINSNVGRQVLLINSNRLGSFVPLLKGILHFWESPLRIIEFTSLHWRHSKPCVWPRQLIGTAAAYQDFPPFFVSALCKIPLLKGKGFFHFSMRRDFFVSSLSFSILSLWVRRRRRRGGVSHTFQCHTRGGGSRLEFRRPWLLSSPLSLSPCVQRRYRGHA